jgi:hypothetical protein
VPHLISFDIDGTLETGNGPGPITLEMVRRAVEHGHIIGSASDRPVQDQKNMWAAVGIEVSFAINKHRLNLIKEEFGHAEVFYHIGDTELDEHYAKLHGFEFLQVQTMDPHPWMLGPDGECAWGPHGRGLNALVAHPNLYAAALAAQAAQAAEVKEKEYDYSNG